MLTPKQRAQLRSLAANLPEVTQVGKGGISENLITAADDALSTKELIKIMVLENSGLNSLDAGRQIAEGTGAELVAAIGRTFILYRESQKLKPEKRIKLV